MTEVIGPVVDRYEDGSPAARLAYLVDDEDEPEVDR